MKFRGKISIVKSVYVHMLIISMLNISYDNYMMILYGIICSNHLFQQYASLLKQHIYKKTVLLFIYLN